MNRTVEIKDKLRTLTSVRAGWAFGVPENGRELWLDDVAAAVQQPRIENESPGYDRNTIYSFQDDLLIDIVNGKPLPTKWLRKLPPFRAYLIAQIAEKAGVGLEQGTAEQLGAEAAEVSGHGMLGEWWNR